MKVISLPPSERMASYVREFTIVETGDEEITRLLIPDTGLIAGFRFGGSATQLDHGSAAEKLPDATMTGLRATARRMRTAPRSGIVLAVFREGGAEAFFAQPLHEIFGTTLPLDDLIPRRDSDEVLSRIAEADDHRRRVEIVEEVLLRRIAVRDPDSIVAAAVSTIRRTRGALRIRALARHLGLSQDALEKRFRRAVGASPKQYASIVRLRHAVKLRQSGATLTRASLDAGYFDQAHWNRQFRAVMGETPQSFFEAAEYC